MIGSVFFFEGHGEARDEMSSLPREAAVRILSYLEVDDLARCAQVCRNWKMLTQSSMLWAKLDLHATNDYLDDPLATRFIQRARPYLQHLNLRECSRIGRLTFLGKQKTTITNPSEHTSVSSYRNQWLQKFTRLKSK